MSTIKSKEDAGYTVNGTDLIPLVDAAGLVAKSVTPRQMFKNMRGDNVLLIGDGGDFSSYDDVLTELNTNLLQTVELSFTGTVTGTGTGTTLSYILTADAGTPLAGIAVGTVIAFRVDNATNKFPYVLGRVIDSAVIMANHPFPIDYASKNVDVCFPKYSKVQFLPGSEIILDSFQAMPPFVVLDGSENSAKLVVETSGNAVMVMGGETNEVYCNNLIVIQSEQQFVNFTLAPFSELGALMGDSYFYYCNKKIGSVDA